MKSLKSTSGSVRTKRILAVGAAAAVLFSGAGLVAANTVANAAATTASAASITQAKSVNLADSTQVAKPGATIATNVLYTGLSGQTVYFALTKLVDAKTGEQVAAPQLTRFITGGYGFGGFDTRFVVPVDAAGKTLVVTDEIYAQTDVTGTVDAPGGIKAGAAPLAVSNSLTNADKTIVVPGTAPITAPEAPIGSQPTTTPGTSTTATIVTTATDKADGDKSVAANGIITDVVNYTGLNPGGVYVLQTTLWNKTDGFATPVNISKIFVPKTASGTITVEVPVPAGYDGKELVVFQTIYNGADAVVGKHLNVVKIRDGKTYIVAHRDPNDTAQTVNVPKIIQPCKVSGYVWKDANNNGLMDAGEQRVANVGVDLRQVPGVDQAGTFVKTTTTNADGYYEFTLDGSQCGHQFITDFNEATFPADWKPFGGGDSDILPYAANSGWTTIYNLYPGDDLKRVDGGLRQVTGATIVGHICSPYAAGYKVDLINTATNAVVGTTTIDANGNFSFANLPAGEYSANLSKLFHTNGWIIRNAGDFINEHSKYIGVADWTTTVSMTPVTVSGTNTYVKNGCGDFLSPLVLDLNGNGKVDTSSVASQAGAGFDLLSTGSKVDSGWVAKGDGLLVTPNADGTVTSGDNLFGGSLGDGYAKLAKLDTNNDGAVSGAELDGVKVWVDANSDHVSQAGEIKSLGDYGIVSLSTKYANAPVVDNGNVVVEHGVATKADGSSVVVGDAYFQLGALSAANAAAAGKAQAATNAKLATLPVAEAKSIREAFKNAAK